MDKTLKTLISCRLGGVLTEPNETFTGVKLHVVPLNLRKKLLSANQR
jgi:hypothetical protein